MYGVLTTDKGRRWCSCSLVQSSPVQTNRQAGDGRTDGPVGSWLGYLPDCGRDREDDEAAARRSWRASKAVEADDVGEGSRRQTTVADWIREGGWVVGTYPECPMDSGKERWMDGCTSCTEARKRQAMEVWKVG